MGFGRQKQFAVAQARNDWVLCLDADERVSPELERSIRAALDYMFDRVEAWSAEGKDCEILTAGYNVDDPANLWRAVIPIAFCGVSTRNGMRGPASRVSRPQ